MTYVIVATHTYYGPKDGRELVAQGNGYALTFRTSAEARVHIAALDGEVYHQRHNEYGRPSYMVRSVASLPAYLAGQV